MAVVTVSDFFVARWMYETAKKSIRKLFVVLSLILNLGLLAYFKYTNFFGEVIASLTGGEFARLDIFLPVGISFFHFSIFKLYNRYLPWTN